MKNSLTIILVISLSCITDNASACRCDVAILGGGMSGVSTAYHLILSPDFKGTVCLIEGRERLGGRMAYLDLPSGKRVELGANWIHGKDGNPVYDIAAKYGLLNPKGSEWQLGGRNYRRTPVDQTGKTINRDAYKVCTNDYWKVSGDSWKYKGVAKYRNSLGKYMREVLEGRLQQQPNNNQVAIGVTKGCWKNLFYRSHIGNGCHSLEDMTLKDRGAYRSLPGGNFLLKNGYFSVIQAMLYEISQEIKRTKRSKLTVYLNHEVTSVNVTSWGVRVTSPTEVFIAKKAVVTFSIGVLKDKMNQGFFIPPLSERKQMAIRNRGFSVVDKIFLEFNETIVPKYFNENIDSYDFIWTDDGSKKLEIKDPTPVNWWRTIGSVSQISDRVIMLWLTGNEAELIEKMDPKTVGDIVVTRLLRPFLHAQFPDPSNVVVTNWITDKFARGSYSFFSNNSSTQDIDILREPIYSDAARRKPVVLFAGESTHSTNFGTVHGAFLSGRAAASAI